MASSAPRGLSGVQNGGLATGEPTPQKPSLGEPCTHPPPHCTWIKQALSAHGYLSEHQVIVDQCKRVEQTNSAQTKVELSARSPLSMLASCEASADRLPDRGTTKLSTCKDDKKPISPVLRHSELSFSERHPAKHHIQSHLTRLCYALPLSSTRTPNPPPTASTPTKPS